MAIIDINYVCGCGFRAKTVEEAIKHVDERKHILGVSGSVKSSVRKDHTDTASPSASNSPYPRTVKPAVAALAAVAPVEVQVEEKVDFTNLRSRLQKR